MAPPGGNRFESESGSTPRVGGGSSGAGKRGKRGSKKRGGGGGGGTPRLPTVRAAESLASHEYTTETIVAKASTTATLTPYRSTVRCGATAHPAHRWVALLPFQAKKEEGLRVLERMMRVTKIC